MNYDNNQNDQNNFYGESNQQGNFYNQQGGNFYSPTGQPFCSDPYSNQAFGLQKANNAKSLGIAALICSLLPMCCLLKIVGIVLSILAISGASSASRMLGYEPSEARSARTMGIASLIITGLFFLLSIVFTVVYVIVLSEGLI